MISPGLPVNGLPAVIIVRKTRKARERSPYWLQSLKADTIFHRFVDSRIPEGSDGCTMAGHLWDPIPNGVV